MDLHIHHYSKNDHRVYDAARSPTASLKPICVRPSRSTWIPAPTSPSTLAIPIHCFTLPWQGVTSAPTAEYATAIAFGGILTQVGGQLDALATKARSARTALLSPEAAGRADTAVSLLRAAGVSPDLLVNLGKLAHAVGKAASEIEPTVALSVSNTETPRLPGSKLSTSSTPGRAPPTACTRHSPRRMPP